MTSSYNFLKCSLKKFLKWNITQKWKFKHNLLNKLKQKDTKIVNLQLVCFFYALVSIGKLHMKFCLNILFLLVWIGLQCGPMLYGYQRFSKYHLFVFCRRKKYIYDIRARKWQIFYFWVSYPFKTILYIGLGSILNYQKSVWDVMQLAMRCNITLLFYLKI